MMSGISTKDRRTLVGGVLAMGTIVAVGKGMPLWRDWDGDQRARARMSLSRVAELNRALLALPLMADSARGAELRYHVASGLLLIDDSPTIASARLAQLVSNIADDASVTITSLQVRPDTAFRDRFARVAVRLLGTGDIQTLVVLLEALDEQDTLLSVKELSVTPSEPAGPDTKPEALHFQILVEALATRPPMQSVQRTPPDESTSHTTRAR